jgi:hypothetical protein
MDISPQINIQLDLLQRTASRIHVHQALQVEKLTTEEQVHPVFAGSVFTTAVFSFDNPGTVMKRDIGDQFSSLRAITSLGEYGDENGWFLYWHKGAQDRFAIACPPGTTLLIPGSIIRYSFTAIKKGETRFVFQKYFNAAVGRWVENGFKSDTEHEVGATVEELQSAFFQRKFRRVFNILERLSLLNELYV